MPQVKNIGQTAALNIGICAAKGRYIARIDADDIAKPERFDMQVNFLDVHPAVAVVGMWQETIDIDGRVQGLRRFPTDPWEISAGLFTASPMNWFCISHPTVMIRKSALDQVGLYDERLRICQDYDLWVRMARSFLLANVGAVGLQYRAHGQSLSQKNLSRTKDEIKNIIERNIDFLLPDLNVTAAAALRDMLIFDPVTGDPKAILPLFDRFFGALMQASAAKEAHPKVKAYQERIKVLYIPQIIKKDVPFGFGLFIKALFVSPGTVFSKRFLACVWYAIKRKW